MYQNMQDKIQRHFRLLQIKNEQDTLWISPKQHFQDTLRTTNRTDIT